MHKTDPEQPARHSRTDTAGDASPTPPDPSNLPVEPEFGALSDAQPPEAESAVLPAPKL